MIEKPTEIFDIVHLTKEFLQALETRVSFEDIKRFYHPDVVQTEYPNGLAKNTITRNLAELEDAALRGQKVLQKETYEIVQAHQAGNTVILEVIWTGILAMQVGKLPAGGKMKAFFAQVYEYKEGKIYRQRNYDCFEPFS